PGRYFVSVSGTSQDFFERFSNGNRIVEPGYVETYYPGTTDSSMAASVEVQAGGAVSAIDFTLARHPVFRVRGRVCDSAIAKNPRNPQVSITPRNSVHDEGFLPFVGNNYNNGSGTFEIRNVASGSYWLSATAGDDSSGPFGARAR